MNEMDVRAEARHQVEALAAGESWQGALERLLALGEPAREAVYAGVGDGRWPVRLGCAVWLDRCGDEAALRALTPLIRDPKSRVRVFAVYALGHRRGAGENADAVPLLEDATKHFPENEELQNMQLNAYAISGQIERAIEVYGKTVEDNPENKIYRYNYGSLLLQAERHDDAINQLKEAVRIDEAYTDAQYNLGAAYVNKAIAVNNRINEIDDDLRANKSTLSAEEISSRESQMDKLGEERRELFGLAITPLAKAKTQGEAEGREVAEICRVLFQSYVQTGQTDKAETVSACAGY